MCQSSSTPGGREERDPAERRRPDEVRGDHELAAVVAIGEDASDQDEQRFGMLMARNTIDSAVGTLLIV